MASQFAQFGWRVGPSDGPSPRETLARMTTTPDGRPVPPLHSDERTMLTAWLDFHRATLALKCAGLDDVQVRQASVPPSAMTMLGLVRHLTGVERNWFQRVFAGEEFDVDELTRQDGGFALGLDAEAGAEADADAGAEAEADAAAGAESARGRAAGAEAGMAEALAVWRETLDRNRALVAAASLDDSGRLSPQEAAVAGGDTVSLRWILVHMIEEYARHNGHADLLRERIDGATGP